MSHWLYCCLETAKLLDNSNTPTWDVESLWVIVIRTENPPQEHVMPRYIGVLVLTIGDRLLIP